MANSLIRGVIPHLVLSDAVKALEFYKEAFGAEVGNVQPGPDGRIYHGDMTIGGASIFVVDEFREQAELMRAPDTLKGTTVAIALMVDDADAVFERAVKAGAKAHLPVQDTFWGARYAQVVDPYGHLWEINQEVRQVSPEAVKKEMDEHLA